MKNNFITKVLFLLCLAQFSITYWPLSQAQAQVAAHMKLWDRKYRYPRVNSVEFRGDVPQLASYDAVYGHGAMWENEWIGFRVYVDHRQSVDLYGKKYTRTELDQTNFYTTDEQWQQGYGEDILFVGASVGAGSFRGYEHGQPTFVNPVLARGQRVLNEGPDTAIVEIYATDWQYKGRKLQFRQRFTAFRGQREVQVDVWLDGCSDSEEFATGVQKFQSATSTLMGPTGFVATWGTNVPDRENHPDRAHTLGMAVRVAPENLVKLVEDPLNLLCIVHPVGGHIRYWLSAASDLQSQGGFHSPRDWFQWVKENCSSKF